MFGMLKISLEDSLMHLQGLPKLGHLEFLQHYVGETFNFNAKGFPCLKVLKTEIYDNCGRSNASS
jgi:hypothetical protein